MSARCLRRFAPRLEALEHRRLLAATVTVVPGSLGAGSLDSTFVSNGGQLPLTTPDAGGDTLSAGALASIGAASDIVVDAQGAITIDNLGSALSLQTGSGNGVSFSSAAGAVTFASPSDSLVTAGGRITLEAGPGAGLTVADLNSKGGEIDLFADSLSIDGAVNAGPAALVHLDVRSAATPIAVGSSLGSSLNLPETELNQLIAGVLEIGDMSDIGGLTVTAPIALSTSATGILNTFNLRNGGPIAENAGGSIAVYALALQSGDGVNLSRASNVVSNLAFNNTSGNVTFANAQTLAIASVDGLTASSNAGATTNLSAAGPLTFAATVTSAGTLTAKTTANANPAAPVGVISVSPNATVESTAGNVVLDSVGALDVPAGANVLSDTGTVQLSPDFASASVTAGTEIQGTVNGTSLTVHGGSSLLIDFTSGAVLPHGLTFSSGTNASLTISDQGGAAAHDYVIDGSSVVRDSAAPIKFGSGTARVTVDGGDSAGQAGDTFNVTPSANIAFTLNGRLPTPPANPGDVLIAPAGGSLTKSFDANSGFSGTWTFTGDQPITFAGFETLEYPPTITGAGSTTFTVGSVDSFVVATDGLPSPTVSQTGTLPGGVTFDPSTNTLGGTPSTGDGGIYPLNFDATNGVGSDATQSFTLTVDEAPAFTSSSAAVFAMGMANSFNVTTSGFPAPTVTELGTLPNGVSFNAATGVLKGTPALGTSGVYSFTFTASNGVGGNATQNFTLSVTQPQAPAITSAASVTFTAGTEGTFTVTASGTPTPTLSETGALPAGVTFDAATGVLSGTASSGTGRTYPITFQASNGAGNITQSFVLTVDEAASITSANGVAFTPGTQGSFVVTAGGFPVPTLSESGPLPGGVTFEAATDSLSGTPTPGTDGNYAISFSAHNGIGSDATQNFTLAVDEAPVFTSANAATFTVGFSSSFAVTASGFPAPAIGESGALPNGVTFDSATGTLSGTPGQGTGGTYAISFSAANGFGSAASQSFTLTVDQAPAVNSANSADFVASLPGSFTVTTTGFPAPSLSESGTLPGGVTFDAATGTLSGTPDPGTVGTYDITFTATNGIGSDAAQAFTLTVAQPQAPNFTSPSSDTFTVGVAGTLTVAATGTPPPSLSESGPLPSGVTFDAATGALAGTPGPGTSGTYAIQFTAANGVGSNCVQDFTLTVDQAPSISSVNAATFTAGSQGSFTVTAGGFPAPSLSESGALPANVTFDPSSGMLAGVPAAGTGGTYDLSFTAHN
ncbi:MAG TPA: putative Ig domain-containing protein, partial [Pirellulales bacterium]|nr:putative Ig domain-containing protein [Pirellulales bacterium]